MNNVYKNHSTQQKTLNKADDLNQTLDNITYIYFIGIGGIGMSALAHYFKASGKVVAGYDKAETEITKALENLGIAIHFEDDISLIHKDVLNPKDTLIVYTPAIPDSHTELQYFKTNEFKVLKRSQVLGEITKATTCLAVAGTHGKTTTTSILAHLLKVCDAPITGFLGGISENYNSNLIQNGTEVTVVEADEFDRSFLTLSPDFACITSMDADHLDIYDTSEALIESFKAFTKKLKPNGQLFVKNGLPLQGITYGIEDNADYSAQAIKIKNGSYWFNLKTPYTTIQDLEFSLPGHHNLSNALAALAMAIEYGCEIDNLKLALRTYKGVKRRFTYHVKRKDLVYIDDYAHHPEEINAVHQAVREMYPNKTVCVVFQPHLFSRTKDFADEFAKSLSKFDCIYLLDIYPARELPIKGIDSKWLLDKIENPNKKLITKSEIITEVKQSNAYVILTLGAGDIGEEVTSIKQALHVEN